MRPVFAGNLEYDTRQSDLERLFSKYGRIERVDMKSGIIPCFTILMLNQGISMFFVEFTCYVVVEVFSFILLIKFQDSSLILLMLFEY
jgi:hypothetical protein